MIIEVRAKNCYAFEDDITFSMKADMRNKKFGANVHKENNFNVLKTVGIYGPNNAGKTCLIKWIILKSSTLYGIPPLKTSLKTQLKTHNNSNSYIFLQS